MFGTDIQDVMGTITLSQNDTSNFTPDTKVNPDRIARLYADWIMPLNKQVQVKYLLHRLDEGE